METSCKQSRISCVPKMIFPNAMRQKLSPGNETFDASLQNGATHASRGEQVLLAKRMSLVENKNALALIFSYSAYIDYFRLAKSLSLILSKKTY